MAELSAAQQQVLPTIAERVPIERLTRIWIFPPHQGKQRETGLFAFGSLADESSVAGLQALDTLSYVADASGGKAGVEVEFSEEGWAPADRIERVIEGAMARSGDLGDPLEFVIDGSPEKWAEMLETLGIRLDPANE